MSYFFKGMALPVTMVVKASLSTGSWVPLRQRAYLRISLTGYIKTPNIFFLVTNFSNNGLFVDSLDLPVSL